MERTLALAVIAAALLSGCVGPFDAGASSGGDATVSSLLAGAELWPDPQNRPHPAYGWPTLSSPAPTGAPVWWDPIAASPLPASISGLDFVGTSPGSVDSGAGIAVFGRIAFVPGFGSESYVLDIGNPAAPQLLSTIFPEQSHRGAAMIAYPDGRLVAVVSTNPGFDVYDLTDPTDPVLVSDVRPVGAGHKLGVVPGTPIVYNAGSDGGQSVAQISGARTGIYDLSNPAQPVLVQNFNNGYSCHHIYFWNSPAEDMYRAICAGMQFTQIWDTADPLHPEVIVEIPMHHGVAGAPSAAVVPVTFSHFSILSMDGKTLIVGDETGGGGYPPGCVAGVHTASGSVSAPVGALWFYDVSDETNPTLQGWFSIGQSLSPLQVGGSCTAHHGRLVPAEGRDMIAMAFYRGGVVLLDFTDPKLPIVVDEFKSSSNTWEVWYDNGYLFTGDLNRGLDVLSFV